MAKRVVRAYVDKNSKKLVKATTPFKGTDERFKELEKLGFVDEVDAYDDLTKEKIIEKLEEKGIEYNGKDNKQTLFNLLNGEE